jgi:hypothetical protein
VEEILQIWYLKYQRIDTLFLPYMNTFLWTFNCINNFLYFCSLLHRNVFKCPLHCYILPWTPWKSLSMNLQLGFGLCSPSYRSCLQNESSNAFYFIISRLKQQRCQNHCLLVDDVNFSGSSCLKMTFVFLDLVSLATGETFSCNFFIPFNMLHTSLESLVFFIGNVFCVFLPGSQ